MNKERNNILNEVLDATGSGMILDRDVTIEDIVKHVRFLEERVEDQVTRKKLYSLGGYGQAAFEALDEVRSARRRFSAFNSAHEGYAVMLEEVDELWDEVKAQNSERKIDNMRAEAKQVAAMAISFMVDVCEDEETSRR